MIKVDVEGADLAVLTGGISTIMRFRPLILAEFNPYWMKQIGQGMTDIHAHARLTGYDIYRLFRERFRPVGSDHVDREDEVPSYFLVPEERVPEIARFLAGDREESPEGFVGSATNPARIRSVSGLIQAAIEVPGRPGGAGSVTDVFHRAGITLDRERKIMTREMDSHGAPLPSGARLPWPDCSQELVDANAQYHPAALFPGTRAAGLKRLVLRVINVYTYRQILFNAAVVRILNRWDARLRLLVTESGSFSEQVAEWLEGRIARVEERRGLWEARLASQLAALEDRASAAESDVAALEARARADRARIDSLEDSIRRLEGRLEREREGAGTGVLR